MLGAAAVNDGYSLYRSEDVPREATRIAGAWATAYAGAEAFGALGAAGGTAVAPGPGTAIGGFAGAAIGGSVGYFGGSEAATHFYDWVIRR